MNKTSFEVVYFLKKLFFYEHSSFLNLSTFQLAWEVFLMCCLERESSNLEELGFTTCDVHMSNMDKSHDQGDCEKAGLKTNY